MARVIGTGIGASFATSRAAGGLDADAQMLIARMSVTPDAGRQARISELIRALKQADIWGRLDAFYMLAAHDAQAARLNWRSGSFGLTPVAAPIFTADVGYQGDGATSYLAIAADTVSQFSLVEASVGVWCAYAPTESAPAIGCSNSNFTSIAPRTSGTQWAARLNDSSGGTVISGGPYDGLGLSHIGRQHDGTREVFYRRQAGKARQEYWGAATTTVPPDRILCGYPRGGSAVSYSTAQVCMAYFGGYLTDEQELAMDAAVETYLTAVSA